MVNFQLESGDIYIYTHTHTHTHTYIYIYIYKVKCSRYRPDVAQRVGRGIALLFLDSGTRRCECSAACLGRFTPGTDPVPIVQEAGWATGPVRTGGKSRPRRDSIPNLPTRSSVAIPTEPPDPHTHTHRYITQPQFQ